MSLLPEFANINRHGDGSEFHKLHLAGDEQYLYKELIDLSGEADTEGGNHVVIGVGVGGNVAKGQTLVAGPLDLSAVIHPSGVAIDE